MVGPETGKLITNKQNVLSLMETETGKHMHIYLWVGEYASVTLKGRPMGLQIHENGPDFVNV